MTGPSPLIAEIRTFACGFAPEDWYVCDGRLLRVHEHQPLFLMLGWRFGGDGWSTFALPDLRADFQPELVSAVAAIGDLVYERGGND